MNFEVLQGDCLDVMRRIAPASVDACITDPPYGTTACSWDSVIPFAPMWAELKRIVKPKGAIVLFGSQPFTSALVMSNPGMFKYETIWRKTMPTGLATAASRPMKYHENILVFYREPPTFNAEMETRSDAGRDRLKNSGNILMAHRTGEHFGSLTSKVSGTYREYDPLRVFPRSVLEYGSEPNCNGTKVHPTQKPVDLLRYLVRTYTNAGDTVLDFTCGSGTTGVACAIEGRNSINIEQDAGYCEIARARIMRASGIACDIPKRSRPEIPLPLFEACA